LLETITPVILTFNEEANVGRVLDELVWAKRVVVVDSFSTDNTHAIVSRYKNATLVKRKFDSHAAQWNFAIQETSIETEWVLALDADYMLTQEFVSEVRSLQPEVAVDGYSASFRYCILGRRLRAHLYPPVTVLFRKRNGHYLQEGHTQRLKLEGRAVPLAARILHDDRKPLESWIAAQVRYMRLEADHLSGQTFQSLGWANRVRKLRLVAPFVVLFHCLVVKRLMFDGKAGLVYVLQRLCAETILSLCLLEKDIGRQFHTPPA
jgi:glycosyltransferase involved in cell wall biosynthesis